MASDHCARPKPRRPRRASLRPRSRAWVAPGCVNPRPHATQAWGSRAQVAPGCTRPRPEARAPGLSWLGSTWVAAAWVFLSLWSESLGFGLMFFSCICFWVFRPVHETSNFFKFFWVRETRFPSRCQVEKIPHQTWLIHKNQVPKTRFIVPKSSLKDSRC